MGISMEQLGCKEPASSDGAAAAAAVPAAKPLRRLPHVFCKWVDLPFAEDADVELHETRESYSFVVRQPDLRQADVVAEAVEIVPGVVKVVLRGEDRIRAMMVEKGDVGGGSNWRARLPPCAVMEATASSYAQGVITITIPKLPSEQTLPSPRSRLKCRPSQDVKRSLRCLV